MTEPHKKRSLANIEPCSLSNSSADLGGHIKDRRQKKGQNTNNANGNDILTGKRRRSRSRSASTRRISGTTCLTSKTPNEVDEATNTSNVRRTSVYVPRVLDFSLSDRVSIMFSRFYADQLQHQPINSQLEYVNWRLGQDDGNIRALFPPRITPEIVFPSSLDAVAQDVLTNWETTEHSHLSSRLLQALRETPIFKVVHGFLASVDKVITNVDNFIDCLLHVWFTRTAADLLQYPGGPKTCGFQHVFIGERKKNVKGLHSWQRLFILERQGRLTTQRVIKKAPDFHIAALNFLWDETPKPYGTIFFGLPMDFEMMMFFVAFMMTKNRPITFMLVGRPVTIESYDMALVANAMATAFFRY